VPTAAASVQHFNGVVIKGLRENGVRFANHSKSRR